MSNSTSQPTALSCDIIRALTILPIMDRYILIILYTSGILGSLLNILTLLQKKFHKNPCSLYFLWASITDFFVMNAVLMVDALRYFNPTLFILINSISIWCKIQKYAVFLLPCLSSTFITLACIDRFCTSSHNQHVRKLSQFKISRILILIVLIIWMLFSSHTLILFDIPRNQCRSSSDWFLFILIIDGYFFSMFNGAIVPIFLSIFGFLIYRNVRLSRQRVAPIANTNSNRPTVTTHGLHLNRQNLHLITMLLVQSSLTVFKYTLYGYLSQ
ncbi:hypothetical protein I4U23_003826 [Adineta vaga]|nr:hypothetical protein I4U23_003826 [Adineta vaga]